MAEQQLLVAEGVLAKGRDGLRRLADCSFKDEPQWISEKSAIAAYELQRDLHYSIAE